LAVSDTVFEIFTLKDRKTADFSHPPLFDASLGGTLRISGSNLSPQKLGDGPMGLSYGENFIILSSAFFEILAA